MKNSWPVYVGGIILLALALAGLGYLYFLKPPSPDIAVYDYIGLTVNQGGKMYLDAADQNWPGQMFIHALSGALFGAELTSYRLFELFFILPISCAILAASANALHGKMAAILSAPIYFIVYITADFWMAGQREVVAGPLLVGAAALLHLRTRGGGLPLLFVVGILLASATLIRPTLLALAGLLFLADVATSRLTQRTVYRIFVDHAIIGVTILAVGGALALSGWAGGTLQGWFEASIEFNLGVYDGGRKPVLDILSRSGARMINGWHWYMAWSTLGAYFIWQRDKVAAILICLVAPTTVISLLAQGKGFGYHLASLLPLFAVLISVAVAGAIQLAADRARQWQLKALACVLVLIPALGLAKKLSSSFPLQFKVATGQMTALEMYDHYEAGELVTVGDMVSTSQYLSTFTNAGDRILFWGRPTHVYNLTGLRSPLFAASFALLDEPTPSFVRFDAWYARAEAALAEAPPAAIMLVRDPETGEYQHLNPGSTPKIADLVESILPRYTLVKSVGNIDIYRLQDAFDHENTGGSANEAQAEGA